MDRMVAILKRGRKRTGYVTCQWMDGYPNQEYVYASSVGMWRSATNKTETQKIRETKKRTKIEEERIIEG